MIVPIVTYDLLEDFEWYSEFITTISSNEDQVENESSKNDTASKEGEVD